MLSESEKKRIAAALERKGALQPCPRCGTRSFAIADAYGVISLQDNLGTFALGGPSIPYAIVICTNCGWLSQHALGALGLLPPASKGEQKHD